MVTNLGSGMARLLCALASVAGALLLSCPALADDWLAHPKDATCTYSWSDSEYNPTRTKEKVTVKETKGDAFTLAWTTADLETPPDAAATNGTVSFQETSSGIVNTNWTSDPPPAEFPILCAAISQCGNSLASVWFNVIWGGRVPTLAEPLLRGASWGATGGYRNDVASSSDYLGTEMVKVPAFA